MKPKFPAPEPSVFVHRKRSKKPKIDSPLERSPAVKRREKGKDKHGEQ